MKGLKCRSTSSLLTALLFGLLGSFFSVLLGLSFGSHPVSAYMFTGSHGTSNISSGYIYVSDSPSGANVAQGNFTIYAGTGTYYASGNINPYLVNICFKTSDAIPYNSLMNFTVSMGRDSGLHPIQDFVGFVGDNYMSIVEQDIEEYSEGMVANITAVNMGGANRDFCLGTKNRSYIGKLNTSSGVFVNVSKVTYIGVTDGQTLLNTLNNVTVNLDAIQADTQTSRNHLNDIKLSLQALNIDGIISSQEKNTTAINNLKDLQQQASQQAHSDAEAQLEESKKQTEAINETKDFVTNTETPEAGDIANEGSLPSVGLLPSGPLDSILTLPLNIANSILNSLGGNCTPIVAPLPYVDQNLTFPCMGETIYRGDFAPLEFLIGGPIAAVMLFYYFKHLYKKVDRAVSLESTDEDEWGIL